MALTTKQKRLQQENQRYWDRREREALQHQRLRSKAETYDTHIRRTLEHTLEQVQKEIDAFYRKYATKEGISIEEAKRRASNMDIEAFAAKAKEYVDSKDFSDEANEALRLYNLTMKVNRLELLKAQIGLDMVDDFNELQKYFDRELTEDTLAELRRQAGILGETVIDPAGKASEIVNGTWYNARLSERIWLQQDLLRFQLEGLLTDGILQGKNPRVLARELKKKFNTTTYNCQRLMRTELARVQIGAQQAEYEENDVEEFEFIANSTACPICAELDGKHFKVKDLKIANNAPPMHPNCMCSTAPYQDEAEWDAKQNFISNGGSSKEWDKLSQAERDKLIAQARENNKKIEAEVLKAYRENSKINGEEQFRELTLEGDANLTARRKARLEARSKEPDFEKMSPEELKDFADNKLKTKLDIPKGTNNEAVKEAVSVLYRFEQALGGNTLPGLSVKFVNNLKGVYAKFDNKTNALLLPKGVRIKAAEESMREANARYHIKWKTDKDYYATDTYAGTIWHELGHAVDIYTGQRLSKALSATPEIDAASVKVSAYAGNTQNVRVSKRSEAWAENFAAYMDGGKNSQIIPKDIRQLIDDYFNNFKLRNNRNNNKIKSLNLSRTESCPTIVLPKKEYGKVIHELNNNLTKAERDRFIITRAIDDYYYTVENYGFNDYRIIGKKPIERK